MTAEQRSLRASIAAYTRWSREDPRPALEKTREAFESRFEREVDPDGVLPSEERARRAEAAKRAYMRRLALSSAKARAARKAGRS
jgi:hypothetical protein